jgi:hypothetical protein
MNYSSLNYSLCQRSNHVEISRLSGSDNRASKGIGTALANGLAAARASVAVTYASERSSAEAAVTAITASGAAGARLLFPRRKPVQRRFK